MESKKEFIEILNWKKYQERMPDKASWFKVHCSLANCEAFQSLDYKSQMLLIGLWMFAAESGRYIIKADRRYLFRNIRILKEEPDLEPLLNAVDDYGRPNPFIRYCDAPVSDGGTASEKPKETALSPPKSARARAQSKMPEKARAEIDKTACDPLYDSVLKTAAYDGYISVRKLQSKFRIGVSRAKSIIEMMKENGLLGGYFTGRGYAYKPALEKCNTDKRREDKRREDGILTDSGKEKEERKEKTGLNTAKETQQEEQQNPKLKAQQQKAALMQIASQDSEQKPVSPLKPDRPDESAVISPDGRTQPTSSFRGGQPQSIGRIIKGNFKINNESIWWSDPECVSHGRAVIEALGFIADLTNENIKSEWGAFTNWLFKLKGVCSNRQTIEDLKSRMIQKAHWVNSSKCKRKKNPQALLTFIMAGELSSRGIHLPDIRASPAM